MHACTQFFLYGFRVGFSPHSENNTNVYFVARPTYYSPNKPFFHFDKILLRKVLF